MIPGTENATLLFANASLIIAFFGGIIMLFAPCCITLMLPAYLGSVFKAKRLIIFMTLVFAAGVATIMLPIVLGARFLASFFNSYHLYVYAFGSLMMIGIGLMSLFGKTIELPFVSRLKTPQATDMASVYALGVVSGISSSCCAPVLLGALSLAALSPSLLYAAGVGLAYTFGIVFPLFLFGLFYEKGLLKWGLKLQQKQLSLGKLKVTLSNFLAFIIFTSTGAAFLFLAVTNRSGMSQQAAKIATDFKYLIDQVTRPIRSIPGSELVFGAMLFVVIALLVKKAIGEVKSEKSEP